MNRREFLKNVGKTAIAGGAALAFPIRLTAVDSVADYDLAAVYGGEPYRMVDRALNALGGIGRFVSRGDNVLIKPNASWNLAPERAATTNPHLVGRVIEHCFAAGAARVVVTDHILDSPQNAYDTNLIGRYTRQAGGIIAPGNQRGSYQQATNNQARVLRSTLVHEALLEADVFINMPILKHHSSTLISCAMKNYIGLIWNQNETHRIGLNQAIADLPLYRRPDLNIVDAYDVLKSGGPRGSSRYAQVERKHTLIAGSDIVAVDCAAALTWGIEPERVSYIGYGEQLRLGSSDLDSLRISRQTM